MIGARAMRVVLAVAVTAGLLAGCGVSEDDEPRLIPIENVPFRLVEPESPGSTTAPRTPLSQAVKVYFIDRSGEVPQLAPTDREVTQPEDPHSRLEALLSQRPDAEESDAGLTSSIPRETALLGVGQVDDLVQIDLSSNLFSVSGQELVLAFAQLVYTATEINGVSRVRFSIDGQPTNAIIANGQEQGEVRRTDYRALLP